MDITLTWNEVAMASEIGRLRHLSSVRAGRTPGYGFAGVGWTEHCEGACGELAVAKALGRYWDGSINTFSADDLPGLQIRTRSKHEYELIVRPQDSDDATWVLVTGVAPHYRVRGWLGGKDAKRDEWLRDYGNRPKAYFVPHEALRPIEELTSEANEQRA